MKQIKINNFLNKIKKKFFKKNNKLEEYKQKIKKKTKKRQKQMSFNFSKINYIKLTLYLTILIILIILLIIKYKYFNIKNITVVSLDENSNATLIEKNLNYLKQKLIFQVNKDLIKNKIFETEENLKNIYIHKNYPNSIYIEIESYKPLFETKINNKKYFILKNGSLVNKKNIKEKYPFMELKNIKLPHYLIYKKVLNSNNLGKINYIYLKLKENILNLKIKKIIYYKKIKEVHFIINNNTRIIFDLVGNLDNKLKQLYVFNKEKKDITKSNIIYLDNRIEGKIFYCTKENLKQCIKNLNYIYNEKISLKDYKKDIKK